MKFKVGDKVIVTGKNVERNGNYGIEPWYKYTGIYTVSYSNFDAIELKEDIYGFIWPSWMLESYPNEKMIKFYLEGKNYDKSRR